MKCPNCNSNIIDSAIICPVCNTQFAFNAPSSFNSSATNVYEEVKQPDQEVPVSINSVTTLPTEVDHDGEEEINPSAMSYTVAPEMQEEMMRINGQPIQVDDTPYNPLETFGQAPIRQETPRIDIGGIPNVAEPQPQPTIQNTVQPQGVNQAPVVESQIMVEAADPVAEAAYLKQLEVTRKRSDIFFKAVICGGTLIFIVLASVLVLGNGGKAKGKELETPTTTQVVIAATNNTGHRSTFNYPMAPGDVTLASLYDSANQRYTDVDVKGERFITGVEATQLATNYAKQTLNEGFEWLGFEYTVTLNDLTYLENGAISPILPAVIYKWNGFDFVKYNGKNYFIDVESIYTGGNIPNGSSAKVQVLFQMPVGEEEYSLCFGNLQHTLGCFSRN